MPGTAALSKTVTGTGIGSVSCRSAGNCSAGGYYDDAKDDATQADYHAFVVSEVDGAWQQARAVPGTRAPGLDPPYVSVSCASAGNCAAVGGTYNDDDAALGPGFALTEVDGRWQKPLRMRAVILLSVSCASPGSCSAGGYGLTGKVLQAFVTGTKPAPPRR